MQSKQYRVATFFMPSLPLRVSNVHCEVKAERVDESIEGLEWIEVTADRAMTAKRLAARERVEREKMRRLSA